MRQPFYFIVLSLFLYLTPAVAEPDSTKKSHEQLVYEIDELINSTRNAIEFDDKKPTDKPSEETKNLNKENCEKIEQLYSNLKARLEEEYSKIPAIMYQVDPFLVSITKCLRALAALTSQPIYEEADRIAYESAFLFKELAKGNLFRSLNNYRSRPILFELTLEFGYQTNPMYSTFTDAYVGTEWRSENNSSVDFENSNAARNLVYKLALDYKVEQNITIGVGFQSLPSGEINTLIFNDTLPAELNDKALESFTANAFNMHGSYLLIKNADIKKGFEISAGGILQVNNYSLKRQISTWIHEYIDYTLVPDSQAFDTTYIFNRFQEIQQQENTFHSIALGINLSAKYFFNNRASVNASITQYFDTGVNVQQMDFNSRSLPSYTLRLNSFVAGIGVGLHF